MSPQFSYRPRDYHRLEYRAAPPVLVSLKQLRGFKISKPQERRIFRSIISRRSMKLLPINSNNKQNNRHRNWWNENQQRIDRFQTASNLEKLA